MNEEYLENLIKELGLENSMEQNLKELSGGELQRLSIAAVASKDSEFYFFDEPSSYNDVFQRKSVARVIHSLAKIGKSVMVVEHDLTLLDYLSDYIELLYGEPAAYGIVSNVLSTKIGINVFLDGYLPTENVRFRDKKFSFDVSSTSTDEFQEGSEIMSYPKLEKKYPSFSVTVEPGRVRKGEVLGIMGANALGKTTLMKMIAGVEKPDSGEIDKKIKIAYKPQYLQNDIDAEVIALLDKANGGAIEGSQEEEQILEPLKIKKLYNKSVKNLSGGRRFPGCSNRPGRLCESRRPRPSTACPRRDPAPGRAAGSRRSSRRGLRRRCRRNWPFESWLSPRRSSTSCRRRVEDDSGRTFHRIAENGFHAGAVEAGLEDLSGTAVRPVDLLGVRGGQA